MNLLIADDSPEFMESLKEFLENSGHTVFCASDGEQALQIFIQRLLRLILVGCHL